MSLEDDSNIDFANLLHEQLESSDPHQRFLRMLSEQTGNENSDLIFNQTTRGSFPYAMILAIVSSLVIALIIFGLALNRFYLRYHRRPNQQSGTNSYSVSRYWRRQYPSTSFDSLHLSPSSINSNQPDGNESSRILKSSFSWPEATLLSKQQQENADEKLECSSTVSSSSLSNSSTMEQLFPSASLTFALRYDEPTDSLFVRVLNAQNLYIPRRNRANSLLDSYVRVELLAEEKTEESQVPMQSMRTHIIKKNSHPIYDELFQFSNLRQIQSSSTAEKLSLLFTVLTYDTFTRDEILGQVEFPIVLPDVLDQRNAIEPTETSYTREITPRYKQLCTQQLGQMLISLCYQPMDSTITLIVLKASNLPRINTTRMINPYLKIYMFYKGQRIMKKRSTIKRTTQSPVYNECFTFAIPDNDLKNVYFDLILFDYDRHMKHEPIGTVSIGRSSNENDQHWQDVCHRQIAKQIAQWYRLKAFMRYES